MRSFLRRLCIAPLRAFAMSLAHTLRHSVPHACTDGSALAGATDVRPYVRHAVCRHGGAPGSERRLGYQARLDEEELRQAAFSQRREWQEEGRPGRGHEEAVCRSVSDTLEAWAGRC